MRRLSLLLLLAGPAWAGQGAGVEQPTPGEAWVAGGLARPVADEAWWRDFPDARLEALIEEVLAQNLDLAAARDRVDQAKAVRDQQLSAVLPQISLDGSINAQPAALRFAAFSGEPAEDVEGLYYQANVGFNAALELDVFGRSILQVQAAQSDAMAGMADQDDVALALASRVTAAWYDVAVQSETVRLLEVQAKANRDLLEVVQLRFDRGEATAVDVLQQRQQVAAIEGQLPLARTARNAAVLQLAVLLGRTPDRAPDDLPSRLPEVERELSVGDPDDLSRNRPDLRAAELRLKSAWQRRMSAERQFLPTLRATANAGWSFTNNAGASGFAVGGGDATADLYRYVIEHRETLRAAGAPLDPIEIPDTGGGGQTEGFQQWFNWGFGGQITVPIFLGGRNIAGVRQARAAERIAADQLASAEIAAQAEVENAITADREQRVRLTTVRSSAEDARAAYEAAVERYANGVGDYLTLLTTQVTVQNAELNAIAAHRDVIGARITLHEALGGSWTEQLSGGSR